jgi:DNA-binding CsgD family transcriptional regulator
VSQIPPCDQQEKFSRNFVRDGIVAASGSATYRNLPPRAADRSPACFDKCVVPLRFSQRQKIARFNAPPHALRFILIFARDGAILPLLILFRIAERGLTLMAQQALEVLESSEPIATVRSTEHDRFDTLTRRERDVFEKLITGASNKEVGRRLGISPRTIEIHRARILKKLGVRSVADMVRMAMRLGIEGRVEA